MHVVGHALEMPDQFAGPCVEDEHRVRVEIRAESDIWKEVRRRVGDREIDPARFGIERERRPDGTAADQLIARVAPCLRSRLARFRHGVEPPHRLAIRQPERPDPAAHAVLGARGSDDHQILEDDGRHRERLALGRIGGRALPQQVTGPRVERDERSVGRAADQPAVLDRHTAILRPELLALRPPIVAPSHSARRRVERDGRGHGRRVHHALVHDRVGVKRVRIAELVNADWCERGDVLARDAYRVDEALAAVIVVDMEPAGPVGAGAVQFLLRRSPGPSPRFLG